MHVSAESLGRLLEKRPCEPVARCSEGSGLFPEIDHLDKEISYEDFFEKYILANRPCILGKWSTQNWKSVKFWKKSHPGKLREIPNFAYLKETFGAVKVPVADCRQRYYNSQQKEEWIFKDYITYWKKYMDGNYPEEEACLYLKDWHFSREFSDYSAYETPIYFKSDWLNEFWDNKHYDDFRFVYMGPKGSWTPFHADVYRSFSWSANICGKKKWILYSPGQEEFMKAKNGELPYDVGSKSISNMTQHPYAHLASSLTVIQDAGEIIFVPSGWYHQVHNLEDTISINHNWLNSCSVSVMWKFLCSELTAVKREIRDCKASMTKMEWLRQCQVIMKADSGIDLVEFAEFLRMIALPRIYYLRNVQESEFPDPKFCVNCGKLTIFSFLHMIGLLGVKIKRRLENTGIHSDFSNDIKFDEKRVGGYCCFHAIFDLCMILDVLSEFLQHQDVDYLGEKQAQGMLRDDADRLLSNIFSCLQNLCSNCSSAKS